MSIADSNKLIDVIFLSISGGTFIYVACSKIIVSKFDKGNKLTLSYLIIIYNDETQL